MQCMIPGFTSSLGNEMKLKGLGWEQALVQSPSGVARCLLGAGWDLGYLVEVDADDAVGRCVGATR